MEAKTVKTLFLSICLAMLMAASAKAQCNPPNGGTTCPPFTNVQPQLWFQWSGYLDNYGNPSPPVGAIATCTNPPQNIAQVYVNTEGTQCGYGSQWTYSAVMTGGSLLPGSYRLYSAGYENVYNSGDDHSDTLNDYSYETNCSCLCVIKDYVDDYSCP